MNMPGPDKLICRKTLRPASGKNHSVYLGKDRPRDGGLDCPETYMQCESAAGRTRGDQVDPGSRKDGTAGFSKGIF